MVSRDIYVGALSIFGGAGVGAFVEMLRGFSRLEVCDEQLLNSMSERVSFFHCSIWKSTWALK